MSSKNVKEQAVYLPLTDACCPLGCPNLRLGGKKGFKCAKTKQSMEVRRDGIPLRLTSCTYKKEAA